MLSEVKSIVSKFGCTTVQIQTIKPQLQENGMTISVNWTMGSGSDGKRDFSINLDTLEKMAADEKYKPEVLEQIRECMAMEKNNQSQSKAYTLKSVTVQSPMFYMDFWNDKKESNGFMPASLINQSLQAALSIYDAGSVYINKTC